ncbi:hypothetical protein MCECIE61_00594 [Candidatus Methylopumilus planktonicus]
MQQTIHIATQLETLTKKIPVLPSQKKQIPTVILFVSLTQKTYVWHKSRIRKVIVIVSNLVILRIIV